MDTAKQINERFHPEELSLHVVYEEKSPPGHRSPGHGIPRAVQMCLWGEMAVTSGVAVAPALSRGLDWPVPAWAAWGAGPWPDLGSDSWMVLGWQYLLFQQTQLEENILTLTCHVSAQSELLHTCFLC